jgi:serine/threonine protein kinase
LTNFVMEYLPCDLGTLVGAPLARCVEAGRQIAEALACLHHRGLVHRDLKPSNVLVADTEPLAVKLADFGIARGYGLAQITEAGRVLGTLGYLAPEQLEQPGGAGALDARGDLYALGCLLFELIGGQLPFRVPWELRAPPDEKRHIRRLVPEAPEALDALLYALLARSPAERPRDASEVAEGLTEIASDMEVV